MADENDNGFSWDGLWEDISGGVSGFLTDDSGGLDWGNIATVGGGIAGALGLFDGETPKVGYQGKIPRYTMVRDKVPGTNDPSRRPGSSGQRYLTRPRYVESAGLPAARAESEAEAGDIAQRNAEIRKEIAGPEVAPTTSSNIMDFVKKAQGGPIQRFSNGGMPQANTMMQQRPAMPKQMAPQGNTPKPPMPQGQPKPQMPMQNFNAGIGGLGAKPPMPMPMPAPAAAPTPQAPAKQNPEDILASLAATGRVAPTPAPAPAPQMAPSMPQRPPQMPGVNPMAMRNFAGGGIANVMPQRPAPRQGGYLGGQTDGMADRIPANIEGQQPAALSDGEFVVPADVVSHLGNGNSNAGADNLYKMMEQVRKARTGNPNQGRQIDPNKFMPRG